jgi:acyl-ACP thioesterase
MKTIYETKYKVTTNMRDKKGNLALDSILDLFQDIAGLHADELGSADTQMNQIPRDFYVKDNTH